MAYRLKLMLWGCCCLLAFTPLFSQKLTVDSVLLMVERGQPDTLQVEYLTKLSNYYMRRDLEKTIYYADRVLEQANYERSTLSYIASHDIKEPIWVMSNYVGLIRKRLPEEWSSGLKDYFEVIQTSSRQLYTLIEDFMRYSDLARQDNGKAEEVDGATAGG